ncbi:glycosyltransferase family 2 protein [Cytophagales bacterium LB-30]|uniref:Glycosyltransferase family 2 protein n=1 Tax=Shiella aurantiaca TaxID=3058365 RepID=A0ABT8F822_9BACT|nr:glycosyltransferase family 2 protein [Shiella aurantiaca]MDN4166621.1 glycosyltransferase family 2 protein [Shiella aurantiaca]
MKVSKIPKLSVIVAVYNTENHLIKCLESLVHQDYSDFEVILVDDGSTDQSRAICENYVNSNTHFRYIRKDNGGLSSARNTGLNLAYGEFVMFMDADDWIRKNTLLENIRIAESTKCDVLVFGFIKEIQTKRGVNQLPSIPPKLVSFENPDSFDNDLIQLLKSGTGLTVWNMLIRKEFLKQNNLTFPSYKRGSDMYFLFQLYKYRPRLISNPQPFYQYIAFNTSKKYDEQIVPNHIAFFNKFLSLSNSLKYSSQLLDLELKLFLLWFCHVIPNAVVNNRYLSNKLKLKELKVLFGQERVIKWTNKYSLNQAKDMMSKIMLFMMKTRSPYIMYCFTKVKILFKQYIRVDYKKYYNR